MKTTKSIALAHDSFTQYGGAERVFEAIHELFPDSRVLTLVHDAALKSITRVWKIVPSPLQTIYDRYTKFQHLFPFIPVTLRWWKPVQETVLISSSSSFIKGLKKSKNGLHINYCHTPTRFLWVDPEHAYKEIPSILKPLARMFFWWLKRWDMRAAQNIDVFIANSKEVQKRILQIYGKTSEIVYPFVDTSFWQQNEIFKKENFFLVAGRLQYAKGLDTVIKVFNDLNLELHVIGTGRYESELQAMAKSNITFLGRVNDEALRAEFSAAKGFIYPQFEDFGIMPLEAAACGTATIGLAQGGSLETIIPGVTGELLPVMNEMNLKKAISDWDERNYDSGKLRIHALKFDKSEFKNKFQTAIESAIKNFYGKE